ncbi:MAG TPA: transglutaminase family protein [Pelomicrobium sp.]|nr:transglutaminase family protein [Pelomicrobium sp.]
MLFEIHHVTEYAYSRNIVIAPHTFRLRPRADGSQVTRRFELTITPEPAGRTDFLDVEGNVATRAWFIDGGKTFRVAISMEVETLRTNAFDYLPAFDGWEMYPPGLKRRLSPYLDAEDAGSGVAKLARDLRQRAEDPLSFLSALNQHLHDNFEREIRELGAAQTPDETLGRGKGACRDLAVLFMAVCRLNGIAARFVSGYQHGDEERERRYMHAWPEVYLPGGGWRGFDPSHGLAVADAHVPVAAGARPEEAAPIDGTYFGDAAATLQVQLQISVWDGV